MKSHKNCTLPPRQQQDNKQQQQQIQIELRYSNLKAMTTNVQSHVVDSTTSTRDSNELVVLVDELVKLSSLPSTIENFAHLAGILSPVTAATLQQQMTIGINGDFSTSDREFADALSTITINSNSLAVVYLRAVSRQLYCVTTPTSATTVPIQHAFTSTISGMSQAVGSIPNNKFIEFIGMILPVRIFSYV
jgi:hypothetical protein